MARDESADLDIFSADPTDEDIQAEDAPEDAVVVDTDPVPEEDVVQEDEEIVLPEPSADAETVQLPNPDPTPEPLVIEKDAPDESADAVEPTFALVRDNSFYPDHTEIAVAFPGSALEPNADEHGRIVLSGDEPVQVTPEGAQNAQGLPSVIVEVSV